MGPKRRSADPTNKVIAYIALAEAKERVENVIPVGAYGLDPTSHAQCPNGYCCGEGS
jgi:hypothetical protein